MINEEQKEEDIISMFRRNLIKEIKAQTEEEIQQRVKEFEKSLREMASAKIVSFVDELKIYVTQEFYGPTPKIIIEVQL